MLRDMQKRTLTKIMALLLVALLGTQQIAWATMTDLKDDGSIGVDDVLISVISGYLGGKSINASQGLIKTFITTYGIPKVAGYIVEQLHIKNKILASAARMAISVGLNAGLDAASGASSSSAQSDANTGGGGGTAEAAAAAEAPKGLLRSVGQRVKAFFTFGFKKGAPSATKAGLWNSINSTIGKALRNIVNTVVKGLRAFVKAPFTGGFWSTLSKVVSAPFTSSFWSSFGKGIAAALEAPFKGNFWNNLGSTIASIVRAPFTSGFWKTVFSSFHSVGKVVGRAVKSFFTKNVLRAMWRKGLQAAAQGAAKEAVYELLAKTSFGKKYKNTIELIAQYSGMIVSEAVDIGLAKLDGNRVATVDKETGQLVFVEDKKAASWGKMGAFFRDLGLSTVPSVVQAYAADKGKAEAGILIGAGLTGLSNMLFKAADAEENTRKKRDEMVEGKLTEGETTEFRNLSTELPQQKQELDTLESDLKEAKKAKDQEKIDTLNADYGSKKKQYETDNKRYNELYKSAKDKMSNIEKGMLGAFESELAQMSKSYERLLIESVLAGGISYGLQRLSRGAEDAVYGTIFNFMGSSLVKSLLIFSGYDIFRNPDGDALVNSSADQASASSLKPERKTLGSFFSLFDNVVTEDYANVFVDTATMGRGVAVFDKENRSVGARLVNPYDANFLARYDEYVQSDYKDFSLLGILPVGYSTSEQLLSSMHQQSVKNVQESLSDALYRVGLTSDSPLNKTYVYTHVKSGLNKAVRKELREAYDALVKELEALQGQGLEEDAAIAALVNKVREFSAKEGHWEAFWDYLGLAIGNSPYGAARIKDFIDDIAQLREALLKKGDARTDAQNALLAAVDKYYRRFRQDQTALQQPSVYGRLAVLRESYNDLTNAPVTDAERQQATAALMDNERIAIAAEQYAQQAAQDYAKESLFEEDRMAIPGQDSGEQNLEEAIYTFLDKEKPTRASGAVITRQNISKEEVDAIKAYVRNTYKEDYLNLSLKGLDIYEDLSGNNRWIFGIGQTPSLSRPGAGPQLPARPTLFIIQVGSGVGYVPPQEVLAEIASRATELIKNSGMQGKSVDIRIIAQTDPRGPEALNQELVEKRKKALQALAASITEATGLSSESVEVSSVLNKEPVPGADPAVYEEQRRGQVAIAAQNAGTGETNVISLQAIPGTTYDEFTPKKGDTVSSYAEQLKKEHYPNPDVPLDINRQVSRYLVESGQAEDANKLSEGKTYRVPIENNENFTITSDQTVIIVSSTELDARPRREILKAIYETMEARGIDQSKVYRINLGDQEVNDAVQAYFQLKGAKTEVSTNIRGIQAVNVEQVQVNTRIDTPAPKPELPRPLILH